MRGNNYSTVWAVFESLINAGWAVKSEGKTTAPSGRFSIVYIPMNDNERRDMREKAVGHSRELEASFDTLRGGWYFVVQYANGQVTHSAPRTRPYVEARFERLQEEYARFLRDFPY